MPIPSFLPPMLCEAMRNFVCAAASCTSMNGCLPGWLSAATIESFSAVRTRLRLDRDSSAGFAMAHMRSRCCIPHGRSPPGSLSCCLRRWQGWMVLAAGQAWLSADVLSSPSRWCIASWWRVVACSGYHWEEIRVGPDCADSFPQPEVHRCSGSILRGVSGRRRRTGPAGFQRQAGGGGEFPRACRTSETCSGT